MVIAIGVKYVDISGSSATIRSTQPVPCEIDVAAPQ